MKWILFSESRGSTRLSCTGGLSFDHGPGNYKCRNPHGNGLFGFHTDARHIQCESDRGTGDGGIQFTLPELATAVEEQLPLTIIIWNNEGYGEIRDYWDNKDIPRIGVDIYTPDFLTIARGFGCTAGRAAGLDHFQELVKESFKGNVPTVI